jgi:triphosphatase
LRVGIRRLRSGLRSFGDWVPPPPEESVDGLRGLFATLGVSRDGDVLGTGVAAALEKAGAPALSVPVGAPGPDPGATVRADETQRLLLAWITWRASLLEAHRATAAADRDAGGQQRTEHPARAHATELPGTEPAGTEPALAATGTEPSGTESTAAQAAAAQSAEAKLAAAQPAAQQTFRRDAERRLRRWHRRIAADWKRFDDLDEESLHALRKRIKRQRYAVEFFAPVLRNGRIRRYLKPLASIQDRMGELNDLFVARTRYRERVGSEPAAWFALGWIEARIAAVRALAGPELKRLAKVRPPVR